MSDLNRRNTETITAKLADMDKRLYEMHDLIKQQNNTITTMSQRMIQLEQQVLIAKVRMTGTGPSTT